MREHSHTTKLEEEHSMGWQGSKVGKSLEFSRKDKYQCNWSIVKEGENSSR